MAAKQLFTIGAGLLFPSKLKSPRFPPRFSPLSSISSPSLFGFGYGRLRFSGGVRREVSYSGNYNEVAYPKPTEIEWKKELCNSVQLIGVVGKDVEMKQLSSGKVLAWTSLAVRKSATDTSWVNLTFWDDLAHTAVQHVRKGQQVYVSGRLVADTVEGEGGKQETYYKVVVQQLNFIEKTTPAVPLYGQNTNTNYIAQAPSWTSVNKTANGSASAVELWQAFFSNPAEWWDNRKNKKSPKHPDFKHKDTGEALWIEGRNTPHWVESQLSILDSRMETFKDRSRGSFAGDNISSFL